MNMKDSDHHEYCAGSLGVRKGSWTQEEDTLLRNCVHKYGEGSWHQVPTRAGLNRCRKSCRLRWLNYLKPNIKRGLFTDDEVDLIIRLHKLLGNRWSLIAGRLPGRTGNDIKNYWNTHLRKRMMKNKQEDNKSSSSSEVVVQAKVVLKKNGNDDDDDDDDDDEVVIKRRRNQVIIRPRPRRLPKIAPNCSWRPPVQLQSSHVAQTATTDDDDDWWWDTLLQQQELLLDPETSTNFQDGLIFNHHNKYYYNNNNSITMTTAPNLGVGDVYDQQGDQAVLEETGCGFYFNHNVLELWNF